MIKLVTLQYYNKHTQIQDGRVIAIFAISFPAEWLLHPHQLTAVQRFVNLDSRKRRTVCFSFVIL